MEHMGKQSRSFHFIPAKCPSCGGELRVPDNIDVVKCMYCSSEVILRDSSNAVHGSKFNIENLQKLSREAEKGKNFEEAYRYYSLILESDPDNSEVWLRKGNAAGQLSTLHNSRVEEMKNCFITGLYNGTENTETFKSLIFNVEAPTRILARDYCFNLASHFKDQRPISDNFLDSRHGDEKAFEELRISSELKLLIIWLYALGFSLLEDEHEDTYHTISNIRDSVGFSVLDFIHDAVIIKSAMQSTPEVLLILEYYFKQIKFYLSRSDDLYYDSGIIGVLDGFSQKWGIVK